MLHWAGSVFGGIQHLCPFGGVPPLCGVQPKIVSPLCWVSELIRAFLSPLRCLVLYRGMPTVNSKNLAFTNLKAGPDRRL